MATADVRMEAVVRGSDGEVLGRVWAMLVGKQDRDLLLTHLQIEGGAFRRDALIPFKLIGRSSGQELALLVTGAEALRYAEEAAPADTVELRRNDPVYAIDARLGHVRGFYVNEAGKISDLLINDEVDRRLSMVSIRTVDEISPNQIELNSRISAMGELLKPPQAFYQPVELRSEEELFGHGHGAARQH